MAVSTGGDGVRQAGGGWGGWVLCLVLGAVWAAVYLPHLTLFPEQYSDDLYVLATGVHWARTGDLVRATVDSPLPDSAPLRQVHPTPALFNSGFFLLLGVLCRVFEPTLTLGRLPAAVSSVASRVPLIP